MKVQSLNNFNKYSLFLIIKILNYKLPKKDNELILLLIETLKILCFVKSNENDLSKYLIYYEMKLIGKRKKITRKLKGINNVKHIIVPNNIIYMEINYFSNFFKLEYVVLPNKIPNIEISLFQHCVNLKKVIIPNSVKSIRNKAFFDCHKLNNIILPENLTHIGPQAFVSCYSLTEIEIPKFIDNIYNDTFYNCSSLKKVIFKGNILIIGRTAFRRCGFKEIELPETLKIIDTSAFRECRKLKKITIPKSVIEIEKNCFFDCDSLVEVIIKNKNTIIKANAFPKHTKIIYNIEL